MLLKRQEPFQGIGCKPKQVFIRSSYYYREKLIWYVQSHCWQVKVLDFAPFRGPYVREFDLSHSNLVNSIIKITHTHNLHVKMSYFAPFKIFTWKNACCLRDYFAQTILLNYLFFLTSTIKLCIIHYFTTNRSIVCWNTDFYSSHVIPLNETISNYFVNWLLPSLFANANLPIFT